MTMGKKHSLLKSLAVAAGSMYATNKFIDYKAKEKDMCNSKHGSFYSWKHGEIYYTVSGNGAPLLLVHNLDATSSMYEWSKILKKLEKEYTVYAIDLLGCGLSDKPTITYTNYLYVQLIADFIKDIIGEKTNVIASADASSFVIMANHVHHDLLDKIILINPSDIKDMKLETTELQLAIKTILFLPLIGTSLYNYYMRELHIKRIFREQFFSNKNADTTKYVDAYYQTAHTSNSNGRFLFASKRCNYTNTDVTIGLKEKKNLFIIQSTDRKHAVSIADSYIGVNPEIDVTYISKSKLLPQLEVPEQCLHIIQNYMQP